MNWEDDVLTEYMGPGRRNDDAFDDVDNTLVLSQYAQERELAERKKLTCVLVRQKTGEQLVAAVPAIVGRGRSATVRVSGNLAISRSHARLQEMQGRPFIIDLGSTNGTSVRGQRIAAQAPVEVRDGDSICFGSEQFRLFVRS